MKKEDVLELIEFFREKGCINKWQLADAITLVLELNKLDSSSVVLKTGNSKFMLSGFSLKGEWFYVVSKSGIVHVWVKEIFKNKRKHLSKYNSIEEAISKPAFNS